jgi:hypothetical protein
MSRLIVPRSLWRKAARLSVIEVEELTWHPEDSALVLELLISTIEEGPASRKILRHLGLPDTVPAPTPARVDQTELWPTGPPAEFHRDPPAIDDVQRSPSRLCRLNHLTAQFRTPAARGDRGPASTVLAGPSRWTQKHAPLPESRTWSGALVRLIRTHEYLLLELRQALGIPSDAEALWLDDEA